MFLGPSADTHTLGQLGEHIAEKYLQQKGYEIIEKNVRTPFGEVDIITKKNGVLVVVEVKCRKSDHFGAPYDAVDSRKMQHIVQCTQWYIDKHNLIESQIRIDVVSIVARNGKYAIEHIENALL